MGINWNIQGFGAENLFGDWDVSQVLSDFCFDGFPYVEGIKWSKLVLGC